MTSKKVLPRPTLALALPCYHHHAQLPGTLSETNWVLVLVHKPWAEMEGAHSHPAKEFCDSITPGSRMIPTGAPPWLDLALR